MNEKTLFLAWQDKAGSHQWFPVGRLDVWDNELYHFRYVRGAEKAKETGGFTPLYDFPDLYGSYKSPELFPLFKNRVLTPGRRDFHEYLKCLDLPDQADPIEILSVDGGSRVTDSFEVFPKIERQADGTFQCRFFLHGVRHVNQSAQQRVNSLQAGEKLYIAVELTNPVSDLAIQIQTLDYHMIGWAPRYLIDDLVKAISKAPLPGHYQASVVRVNPVPIPSKQRLLIELKCLCPDFDFMSTEDFTVLAK